MRKVAITCLLAFTLVVQFTSTVFGGATINKDTITLIGYSVYTFADLDFVVPDYLVLSDDIFEDSIQDLQADAPKEAKSDASIFAYEKDGNEVLLVMQYAYLDWFFSLIKSNPSEQIESIINVLEESFGKVKVEGIVENISARGMDCYLSTSSFSTGYIAKIIIMFDEANSTCYSLYYLYNEDLDNTVYTDDFYKLLYTEPQSLTVASSTKDTATKDTVDEYQSMHDYLDSVENVSSNLNKALGGSEEDQESMKSYYDALHDYVDAMQQLENAFN